ncbi:MAG: GHKL domain-containing protein [Lachnospiraceae bacterium]|nr:GHKL domain-containing protein [Lachnospiraceae bacterium]
MIYHLQKKVIRICGISVLAVFAVIFLLIYSFSIRQLNETMDALTDRILDNDGRFPEWRDDKGNPGVPDFMTPETPFSTRFFSVRLDGSDRVTAVDVGSVSAITEETAREYAKETCERGRERGWMGDYRYKQYQTECGRTIVYVDGSMNRFMSKRMLLAAGVVLIASAFAIWIIVIFFSKRAVRPVAESYERQKQFITDANHELKTPLTLVMTNLDILETEIGENEWLSDIRSEGERMSALVNQLVVLARMDEEQTNLEIRRFSLSEMIMDVASEFQMLARDRGKSMAAQIDGNVDYMGDETAVRRVISILLDNAVKYCEDGGEIRLRLEKKRHPVFYVENTYADAGGTEFDKWFDRFYRADKARTFTGGFGVGLSIAKAIVTQHRGEINAYKKDADHIGFKVVWR